MSSSRLAIVASFGIACLIVFFEPVVAAGSERRTQCPSSVQIDAGPVGPERLLAAARVQIPRIFRITNQSGRVEMIPANYRISEIVALARTFPGSDDARAYRRAAVRRCGDRVANGSWAVVVRFPNAQTIPASWGVMFFARTHAGWRFWFRYH